ncbi:branched-chain amino acid ABC transporter ATP-binding protein/permease [Rhodococcoides yunnanense]|uniref:branched-chain amino acid ABC transporter ATP-binding protein/permease n=1 Tax=Rhodococcoides yunnanense TaxID=278209 RepID=UPI0009331662|nr:ATP-binding cassette domain-containing protein [Rhodococcus yunnanensis]
MLSRLHRPGFGWWLPPLIGALLIGGSLVVTGHGDQRELALVAIYTLVISGLNFSFGYGGELAFGQIAMLAAGAYTTAILNVHGHTDILLALVLSVAAAAVVGFISGIPSIRLSHWSLAITSFFLVLLVPSLIQVFESQTGGLIGLVMPESATLFGSELEWEGFYIFAMVVALIWLVVMRNQILSRRGAGLIAMRESPQLASSLGLSVYRQRMYAYIMGSLPAGAAGCLMAQLNGFVSPDTFTLSLAIAVLAGSVVGGVSSVYGAPLGALILVLGPLQASAFDRYSLLVYGVFLLLVGVLFASGLAGVLRLGTGKLLRRVAPASPVEAALLGDAPALAIPGEQLVVDGIVKSYGGVRALDGAGIVAEPGQITAVMGANGAGKTTLLNAVSGFVAVEDGTVELGGKPLGGQPAHAVARRGVSRTFQTPLIPRGMTVLEVVVSGRVTAGRVGLVSTILRLPSFRSAHRADLEAARAALSFAGLLHLADQDAQSLPLGTRRLLEVARAVAREPNVVLLDEPAAGLDDVALGELDNLLRRTRDAGATIVIVEHNVSFLLGLADQVFVMDLGAVLASGTSEEIRDHPEVVATYLGRRRPTPEVS